jgi:glycosyltransferase involved in cell wall biosynthesis
VTDREFLTRVADRGAEVHLFVESGEPTVEHPNMIPHRYSRRLRKRIPYFGNVDVAIELRRLLKKLPPVDWIRFNSPAAVGVGALASSGGRRLWASYLHCEDAPFRRLVDRWLPGRCELITCLSEDTRQDVIARCPSADHPGNIVVSMGIDTARVDSAGRPREAVRRELAVGPNEVLVLFVGVLTPRKGIAEEETALVERLVREDPRVRHLPRVPYEQVPEYFRAADVFFFPTHLEGFGIVVAEAMAAGLPVVTTRAKGVRGVVAEGETALCCDVGDAECMAQALDALTRDPELRRRLGAAGRRRVLDKFAWQEKIDTLMTALSNPPGNGGGAR